MEKIVNLSQLDLSTIFDYKPANYSSVLVIKTEKANSFIARFLFCF